MRTGAAFLTLLTTASEAAVREKAQAYLQRGALNVQVTSDGEHLFTLTSGS